MLFLEMIIVGLIVGAASAVLMRERGAAGLFLLSISGSIIAGGIQYAEADSIHLVGSVIGAVTLVTICRMTAGRPRFDRPSDIHTSLRRAA